MLNFIGVSEIALFRENFLRFVNNVKIVGPPVSREEWLPLARKTIVGIMGNKIVLEHGISRIPRIRELSRSVLAMS